MGSETFAYGMKLRTSRPDVNWGQTTWSHGITWVPIREHSGKQERQQTRGCENRGRGKEREGGRAGVPLVEPLPRVYEAQHTLGVLVPIQSS